MKDETPMLAGVAAAVMYGAHWYLSDGFHTEIPIESETTSVGVGLAAVAFALVFIKAYIYKNDR